MRQIVGQIRIKVMDNSPLKRNRETRKRQEELETGGDQGMDNSRERERGRTD